MANASYDLGQAEVGSDGEPYDAALRGWLHYPGDQEGPFPLALLLHGQHQTCQFVGEEEISLRNGGECRQTPVTGEHPNHRGYDYLAGYLASHGIVVASVDANDVNRRSGRGDVGMTARAELVLHTLDALTTLSAEADPTGGDLLNRIDGDRIGLMGHSRGGEGVVTALHVNHERPQAERYRILATIALAPTAFNERPAPWTAFLTILPYCDGDVFSLHGARTFDDTRYHPGAEHAYQVLAMGANHNFYNTQWSRERTAGVLARGDDGLYQVNGDTYCSTYRDQGGGKLTPQTQRQHALLHIGGFLRWHLGQEPALASYFTGQGSPPEAVCPPGAATCHNVYLPSYHPDAMGRLVLEDGAGPALKRHDAGGTTQADGFENAEACHPGACPGDGGYGNASLVDLAWSDPGARLVLRLPGIDASGYDALAFRVQVPSDGNEGHDRITLAMEVADGQGERERILLDEEHPALARGPGDVSAPERPCRDTFSCYARHVPNQVQVPLAALGVDLTDLRELTLVVERPEKGRVQLADLLLLQHP